LVFRFWFTIPFSTRSYGLIGPTVELGRARLSNTPRLLHYSAPGLSRVVPPRRFRLYRHHPGVSVYPRRVLGGSL